MTIPLSVDMVSGFIAVFPTFTHANKNGRAMLHDARIPGEASAPSVP
jgi:hypothetical protein